jgi:hypothetical protein
MIALFGEPGRLIPAQRAGIAGLFGESGRLIPAQRAGIAGLFGESGRLIPAQRAGIAGLFGEKPRLTTNSHTVSRNSYLPAAIRRRPLRASDCP